MSGTVPATESRNLGANISYDLKIYFMALRELHQQHQHGDFDGKQLTDSIRFLRKDFAPKVQKIAPRLREIEGCPQV